MYKSFQAKNFRCFQDLTVEPFKRINLITGKNNVGKTALLEAIWLHHGYYNPELGMRLSLFRGFRHLKGNEFMWELFYGFDPEKEIILKMKNQKNQEKILSITVQEQPTSHISLPPKNIKENNGDNQLSLDTFDQEKTSSPGNRIEFKYTGNIESSAIVESDSIKFQKPSGIKEPLGIFLISEKRTNSDTLAERFGNLEVDKKEAKIVEILKIIEPKLQRLSVRHIGNGSVIYGDIGMERLIPLPLMGDGLRRLLDITLAIPLVTDGILLIDEIENGFHYSIMKKVWTAIYKLARDYNVQIFTTTHSDECVYGAYQAFSENNQDDFILHRLEKVNGKIESVSYDINTLEAALEIDMEVR